jgi:hypothetical protein
VSKNHRTTARKVKAELNILLEDPIPTKTSQRDLHKSSINSRAAIAKILVTENITKGQKYDVMIIRLGRLMIVNM